MARKRGKERARGDPTGRNSFFSAACATPLQLAHKSAAQVIETNNLKKISVFSRSYPRKKVLIQLSFNPTQLSLPQSQLRSQGLLYSFILHFLVMKICSFKVTLLGLRECFVS